MMQGSGFCGADESCGSWVWMGGVELRGWSWWVLSVETMSWFVALKGRGWKHFVYWVPKKERKEGKDKLQTSPVTKNGNTPVAIFVSAPVSQRCLHLVPHHHRLRVAGTASAHLLLQRKFMWRSAFRQCVCQTSDSIVFLQSLSPFFPSLLGISAVTLPLPSMIAQYRALDCSWLSHFSIVVCVRGKGGITLLGAVATVQKHIAGRAAWAVYNDTFHKVALARPLRFPRGVHLLVLSVK